MHIEKHLCTPKAKAAYTGFVPLFKQICQSLSELWLKSLKNIIEGIHFRQVTDCT